MKRLISLILVLCLMACGSVALATGVALEGDEEAGPGRSSYSSISDDMTVLLGKSEEYFSEFLSKDSNGGMTADSVVFTEFAGSETHPAGKYITSVKVNKEEYVLLNYERGMTYKGYVSDIMMEQGWEVVEEREKNLNRYLTVQRTDGDAVYTLEIYGVGSLDFNGQIVNTVTLTVNDLDAHFTATANNQFWWIAD